MSCGLKPAGKPEQAMVINTGCTRSGSPSIDAYVSHAMLQDPWACLMQQYQEDVQTPSPANNPAPSSSVKAGPSGSLSDLFDAAEQVWVQTTQMT